MGHLPDAPPAADAGIDAATRGTVRVTVLDPSGTGAPAVGANVVFVDPDGTLVKRVATDTSGQAQADVLPGGNVTSIVLVNTQYVLMTVLGVKPGDDLVLGNKSADSSVAGTFTVTYPAFTGATSYIVASPCSATSFPAPATGGPPAPAQLTIFNSCKLDTMEIVVVPQGGNGSLGSISKTGVSFAAGATAITGNYQGLRNFTASYTNINPLITSLDMTRSIPDAFGFADFRSMASPGTTVALSVIGPQGSGGQVLTQAATAAGSVQSVRQTISGSATTYGLDVGATLLPWLASPTYDAASRKLRVPTDTTGTSTARPDLFRIVAIYRRTDVNNVTTVFSWLLFGPDATDIVLPTLPVELGSISPTAADTVTVISAMMFDADSVTSYDQVRNDVSKAFNLYTSVRPSATTVRASQAPISRLP